MYRKRCVLVGGPGGSKYIYICVCIVQVSAAVSMLFVLLHTSQCMCCTGVHRCCYPAMSRFLPGSGRLSNDPISERSCLDMAWKQLRETEGCRPWTQEELVQQGADAWSWFGWCAFASFAHFMSILALQQTRKKSRSWVRNQARFPIPADFVVNGWALANLRDALIILQGVHAPIHFEGLFHR